MTTVLVKINNDLPYGLYFYQKLYLQRQVTFITIDIITTLMFCRVNKDRKLKFQKAIASQFILYHCVDLQFTCKMSTVKIFNFLQVSLLLLYQGRRVRWTANCTQSQSFILFVGSNYLFIYLDIYICWLQPISVQTFQPIVIIYRSGNLVYLGMYIEYIIHCLIP